MNKTKLQINNWTNSNIQVFWGEVAPNEHLVQVYENDKFFLDSLEGFAGCSLLSGHSVIIIATKEHLAELNKRLKSQNFNLEDLIERDQYIPIEANDALSKFMVNDWPDEIRFNKFISGVIRRACTNNRKVDAFGEMVALLWKQGLLGATVQLEKLWHELHAANPFTLYCAYPKSGFTQDATHSINHICSIHSKIIDGENHPSTEIYYREAIRV